LTPSILCTHLIYPFKNKSLGEFLVRAHNPKLLALAIATCISASTFAQDDTPALEEMLVTAQKRVQKLQDVPISVNALSGEKIETSGITNIEKLGDYIPSFNMTQTGIGTNIAIRGISSGVNQGFEQSAAQFVDGIHYGRSQLARAPFLDIERVEVLRGPQSILFGKNSTAGAISITTAKPGDEFEAKLTALYEPEHGEQDVRLMVSSPIGETMGMRIAILDSSIDGYMENTTLNRDESGDENRVLRGTFTWEPTDAWDIALKVETGSFDSEGRNVENVNAVYHPDAYDSDGNLRSDSLSYRRVLSILDPGYLLDTTHDFKRQSNGDYSFNNTENVTLNVDYTLGEHTLTSVTGYNAYDYEELCDCDFTGSPGFTILSNEDYSQFSQEFRIASPEDQTFSYLAGVFYQNGDLSFHDDIDVPVDSFIATGLASSLGATANLLRGASTQRDFDQTTDIYAVFAQGTWNITDQSRLTVGARYTAETKDAARAQYHVDQSGTNVPLGTPSSPYNVLWGLFNVEPYEPIHGERDENKVTPSVTYQFDLNSTDMLYASYTTGFKSGGYDVRANSHPDPTVNNAINASVSPAVPITGTFEFEDEEVVNYEIGGKFLLADGSAELNVALFRSEFENMQTSQFDGKLSFNVTNAGEAVVQGLEVDGRWALTDSLLWRGGFAYIDFEYTNFPNSQCYFGQEDNIEPLNDGICDATGKRREFTPELQGNTGLDYTLEFSNGLKLVNTIDLIYSDEYLTTPSLDPKMMQDAFTKINARIALSGNNDMWELALIGRNLTDESVITYANGLPVATTLTRTPSAPNGASSAYYAFYERTRSVALQGTFRF
jgi:iron complex outermembrane receptor protein